MSKFNKTYNNLTESFLVNQPVFLLKKYCGLTEEQFTVLPDNSVEVHHHIKIKKELVKNGKLLIKFNKINGNFNCNSINLTSLEGCPATVIGDFYCNNNKLTSLEHCPTYVQFDFVCSYNQLTSLEGCQTSVGGNFVCHDNKVKFTIQYVKSLCQKIISIGKIYV